MAKSTPILLLLTLLLCGFGPGETEKPVPEPEPEEADTRMDASQSTIDMYVNGTIKASYWVTLHEDPKAGQYWETANEMYGMKTTSRWQVASVDADTAVIENRTSMTSEFMVSDYVIAYEADLTVKYPEDGKNVKPTVLKAWIGRPGKEPTEIKVMSVPAAVEGGAPAEYEMTEEDFKDLELAGKKWSGKLISIKGEGWESKSWTADGGWFGGVVKTESSGYVNQLSALGEDAKPLLKWPEKKDEKKEEKKDETDGKETEKEGK